MITDKNTKDETSFWTWPTRKLLPVYLIRKKYEKAFPSENVLAAGNAYANVIFNDDLFERWVGELLARRQIVLLTDKRVVCARWNIPLETILTAELVYMPPLYRTQVLRIRNRENLLYQFILPSDNAWLEQTVLEIIPKKGRIADIDFPSWLRMIVILFILVMAGYKIWGNNL